MGGTVACGTVEASGIGGKTGTANDSVPGTAVRWHGLQRYGLVFDLTTAT
ncbi:hypothetical protein O9929_06170 [Vibrio lentus]|nr:hypothetical protein [Vibrio lentus]